MPTDRDKTTRKLRAILSADVKGYSLLMADDEAFTIRTLKDYRNIMSTQIVQHNGRVVDSPGDNILADFASIVDAVTCAVEIQKVLKVKNENLPDNRKLEFRIGVNIGDVVQDGDRIYGNGVNVAARIEGLAEPGGVCISRNAYDHIKDKLNFGYEYLGDHEVKNIKDPVRVYKVLTDSKDAGKIIGEKPQQHRKKWPALAVVTVAILIGIIVWQFYYEKSPPIEAASVEKMSYPLPNKPSIAVLPFDNMSGDPDQEFFSDGITEEIITALSKTPKMFVIARNSTFTYKGKAVKVQQVAEELGVRYVLEGSVRKSEGQVRITAQLIDALTGEHMWAERYDREFKDIFALQDEVTKEILTALHIKLTDGEQARIYAKGTDNLEAYLKAMQAQWYAYLWTQKGNSEAKRLIEEAIVLAPDYAYAHRVLGATHIVDLFVGSSKSPKESLTKAAGAYRKAITLDESLASAYGGMGFVLTMMRKYDEAIRLGKKAVALEPNSADVINMYAAILTYAGMTDEAIPMHRTALRLNPKPPITYYQSFGHALRISGQYEEAIALQKKAIEQEPDNYNAFIILATSARLAGYDQEARAAVKEILRIDPQFSVKRLIAPFKDRTILRQNCDALNNAGLSLNCDVFPSTDPFKIKPDKPSIAVLPFVNMSNDPEQEYFSDGMTDELIGDLAKIKDILVISRNSAFTYKGKSIKVQQVAKDLNVRYILEGSVEKSGNKVRIRVQLIDGESDHHLWSESYDGVMDDIFELQDKITGKIVSALAVKLSAPELNIISDKGTKSPLAHEAYLKGQAHLRLWTPDDLVAAIDLFERALELDPEFSQAYTALAAAYMNNIVGGREYFAKTGKEYFESKVLMRHYINLSMENPTSETYEHLAVLELQRRNFDQAILYANKALFIAPNDADTLRNIGLILVFTGQPDKAIYHLDKSMNLDPLNQTLGIKASAYFVLGKYEEAANCFENSITNVPDFEFGKAVMVATYAFLGQEVKAKKALETWLSGYLGPYPDTQTVYIQYTFKDDEVFNQLVNGLIKAGWKADPKAFYPIQKENKLDGQEISTLVFGKTLSGTLWDVYEWSTKISDNGNIMSSNNMGGTAEKGKVWVESDLLCYQYEKRWGGIKYCYDVYRNKKSDKISRSEYLLMGDPWTLPFSVFE